LTEATTLTGDRLCRACFDGNYPIELPAAELLGKHMLEGISRAVATTADGVPSVAPAGGAEDALRRP